MRYKDLLGCTFIWWISACQCIKGSQISSLHSDQSQSASSSKDSVEPTSKNSESSIALDVWEKKFQTDPLFGNTLDEMIAILRIENQANFSTYQQQISNWTNLLVRCSDPIMNYCLEQFFQVLINERKEKFRSLDELVEASITSIHANVILSNIENPIFKNQRTFKIYLEKEHKNILRKFLHEPLLSKSPPAWNRKVSAFVSDPWMVESATYACLQKQNLNSEWVRWIESIPDSIKKYWQAKYLKICDPLSYEEIESTIQSAIDSLQHKDAKSVSFLKIELYYDLIQIYRSLGSRIKMASAYIGLVSAWKDPNLNLQALIQAKIRLPERKIDDFLWAARALVLVGEYQEARDLLKQIKDLSSVEIKGRKSSDSQIFHDFLAEVAHVQSTRIFYEAGQIKEAIATNLEAIKEIKASNTWKNRLLWYLGLFYFAQEEFSKARNVWASLLNEVSSFDPLRPGLLYWLGRVHQKLQEPDKAKNHLDKLNAEFPLSFYITLDLPKILEPEFQGEQNLFLKSFFDQFVRLQEAFQSNHALNELEYLNQSQLRDLFLKYKFSTEIKHSRWSASYLRAIRKSLSTKSMLDPRTRIFLTRLEYESGSYASAFASTQNLMTGQKDFLEKFPEQMFLLFPLPYFKIAKEISFRNLVPIEWLYGVARQESSFRTDVVSPAGAVGLMQLMPATAWMLARDGGLGDGRIASYSVAHEELQNPAVNLEAGARLLARLSKKYGNNEAAVFAAYNAGEYVVDRWLNKRASEDPFFWIEMIPFQETKGYVRSVLRNVFVYRAMIEYDSRKR